MGFNSLFYCPFKVFPTSCICSRTFRAVVTLYYIITDTHIIDPGVSCQVKNHIMQVQKYSSVFSSSIILIILGSPHWNESTHKRAHTHAIALSANPLQCRASCTDALSLLVAPASAALPLHPNHFSIQRSHLAAAADRVGAGNPRHTAVPKAGVKVCHDSVRYRKAPHCVLICT